MGSIEGIFHLPLFFKPGSDQAATGLPLFVLGSMGGAVLFAWLFNNTRGSVLLAMLFHTLANVWIYAFPAPPADQMVSQWAFNTLILVAAVIVVAVFGPARLSRKAASELPVVLDLPPRADSPGVFLPNGLLPRP